MNNTREPDLSVSDVAHEINVSYRKVWELIRTGEFQSYKVGRSRRIPRESIDAFKARNTVPVKGVA